MLLLAALACGVGSFCFNLPFPPAAIGAEQSADDAEDFESLDLGDISLDDLKAEAAKANPMAGCVMCHIDAGDAFKKSKHALEGIGCTDCHGKSKGHVADENNEVKPDEVFARKDVDRLCGDCHDCERPPAEGEPRRVSRRRPRPVEVCIDCHGAHSVKPVPQVGSRRATTKKGKRRLCEQLLRLPRH